MLQYFTNYIVGIIGDILTRRKETRPRELAVKIEERRKLRNLEKVEITS